MKAISGGAASPKEIADATGQPLFRVRSGLRELAGAGFLVASDAKYSLTAEGKRVL